MTKDPKEATFRRTIKALERKYDQAVERGRMSGGGHFAESTRLQKLGKQLDEAQKALDAYLAQRPA